ncbi:MAG: efflux RND transporter periplasmic adaptor subunit [Lachnospiraceae bacterium]|nr:efflux RND transporter periplasmic adaptor subunit [Lachnospiraceae bacterium]
MKEKKKRKKWPLVLIILLILAAAAFLLLSGKKKQESKAGETTTASVIRGTLEVTTEGSGAVEAASTKAVALEYDGKLETIYAETGDQVSVGDVLAVYDTEALDHVVEQKEEELSQLNASIASTADEGSSSITAPVSGRVKRIYASVGDVASKVSDLHGGVAEISADGKMKVEFTYEGTVLTEGDTVTVDFDSYSVSGTVASLKGDTVCVTIKDDTEYQVDTEAVVWGKSGEKLGEGRLLSNHPYLVEASYGIIDSVKVTKETYVNAGDTMFERSDAEYNQTYLDLLSDREELVEELRELKEYRENPEVVSEYDGYIVSLDVLEGMPYEKDQQFCTIADSESLNLKVEIDELDIDGVEAGQQAAVVFDAFEDETYQGTVEKISGVGRNVGGVTTYTVTIALEGDTRLKDAMSATATITLDTRDDVLLVPVDAIETLDGEKYVQVAADGVIQQRAVTLGLINDTYAEVTGGLTEGEQVVVITRDSQDLFSSMMRMRDNITGNSGGRPEE